MSFISRNILLAARIKLITESIIATFFRLVLKKYIVAKEVTTVKMGVKIIIGDMLNPFLGRKVTKNKLL